MKKLVAVELLYHILNPKEKGLFIMLYIHAGMHFSGPL
jgi:hypothetical protein